MARGKAETKRGGALSFSKHMLHIQSHLQTFCDINKVSDDNENDSSTSARRQQLHSVGTKKPKSGFEILSWDTLVAIRKKKSVSIHMYLWYISLMSDIYKYMCVIFPAAPFYIYECYCAGHTLFAPSTWSLYPFG